MNANKPASKRRSETMNRDDAPDLDDAFFERADLREGERVVRRGRPTGSTKVSTTIRFDVEVVEALKASGPGWQTRVNDLVRVAMALKPKA